MTTKTSLRPFAEFDPRSEFVVLIKSNSSPLDGFLTNMNMDAFIPDFGLTFKKSNNQADFIHVCKFTVAEIVKPNFGILNKVLCVKWVASKPVYSQFLWLLLPRLGFL